MKDLKLKIEYLPIDALKPYKNNAKIHTKEQVAQIMRSIEEFGMNDPIAVWSKDNIIVEGHGRLLACQGLGMKTVPIIRLDDLTDDQRKAYTLAHNKLTMDTGFDMSMLKVELEDIDFDMDEFGFDDIKIDVDDDSEREDLSDSFEDALKIEITCENEQQQQELYEEFVGRGLECKTL